MPAGATIWPIRLKQTRTKRAIIVEVIAPLVWARRGPSYPTSPMLPFQCFAIPLQCLIWPDLTWPDLTWPCLPGSEVPEPAPGGERASAASLPVTAEEVGLVLLVLLLWLVAIALFINRWGKIRMLEPYLPAYKMTPRAEALTGQVSGGWEEAVRGWGEVGLERGELRKRCDGDRRDRDSTVYRYLHTYVPLPTADMASQKYENILRSSWCQGWCRWNQVF